MPTRRSGFKYCRSPSTGQKLCGFGIHLPVGQLQTHSREVTQKLHKTLALRPVMQSLRVQPAYARLDLARAHHFAHGKEGVADQRVAEAPIAQ